MAYEKIIFAKTHYYWDYPNKFNDFINRNTQVEELKNFRKEFSEEELSKLLTDFPYTSFNETKIRTYIRHANNSHAIEVDIKKLTNSSDIIKNIFAILDIFHFLFDYEAELCQEDLQDCNEIWLKHYYKLQNGDDKLDKIFSTHVSDTDKESHYIEAVAELDRIYGTKLTTRWTLAEIAKFLNEADIENRVKTLPSNNKIDVQNELINEIRYFSKNTENEDLTKGEYSFASKLCNKWNPKEFPIYDSRIVKLLKSLNYIDNKSAKTLRTYTNYKQIMTKLALDYKLFGEKTTKNYEDQIDFKALDRYLWTYLG